MPNAHLYYPGYAPLSLINAFERSGGDIRPSKRRKVIATQSISETNGCSQSGTPVGYIPLARFTLDLNFSNSRSNDEFTTGSPARQSSIPIFLQTAKVFSDSQHSAEEPSETHEVFELRLATLDGVGIFSDSFTDLDIIDFGSDLCVAACLACADRCLGSTPVSCYKSTLHYVPGGKLFSLETVLLWRDSLISPNISRIPGPARRVFSKFILQEEQDIKTGLPAKPFSQQERDDTRKAWLPRDFYNNVYVPPDTSSNSAEIKGGLIECGLYPFQRRTIRWLLERERVTLLPSGQVMPAEKTPDDQLPTSFQRATSADGQPYFASPLFMTATTDLSGWYDAKRHLMGGILAEEMGLGKTVEMISLIGLNRRTPDTGQTSVADNDGLRYSGATLIITPPAILEQWKQEISLHAPVLSTFQYKGLNSYPELSDQELLEKMSGYDVVLTTYSVLAREIHYSGDAPKRNLRREKRVEPRRTPVVRISWWRVCLDEAQMIESAVSNAARVARLIPRQNAWAVSGTPIRKDVSDLFGLLMFLNYKPFCDGLVIWNRLCRFFQPTLGHIVSTIAIRHSKDNIRSELKLQPQKRIVITVPFTAIEEQHYGELYEQMCRECGLTASGAPCRGDWNPDDPYTVDRMRGWLTRLRQTCLHPEVAEKNRRVLGTGDGPLRSVTEVLEVMIGQNDALIHAEERTLLQSRIRRGQLLENARYRREALALWAASLKRASEIVQVCRDQLDAEKAKVSADEADQKTQLDDAVGNNDDMDKNPRLAAYRLRLRSALEVQHVSQFFIGNAYYQIKTDPSLTEPGSAEFKTLDKLEELAYEAAKSIRRELLFDISQKAYRHIREIKDKAQNGSFVQIPKMQVHIYAKSPEPRRVLDKLEEFCGLMNAHAHKYNEWRNIMTRLLSLPLIDQEESEELEGDEYEKSTKRQDEMYVYMEALRAMFADRHDALTGQKNVLIAHEVKGGIAQARRGNGPSPPLFLSVMDTRRALMPSPDLGSLRGIISELRSLTTSLDWQASGGSSRPHFELELVNSVISSVSDIAAEQTRTTAGLEKEVELFRDTMNSRLEYYRQLQQISDTVAPYNEGSSGEPLAEEEFSIKCEQEAVIDGKVSALKAKRRYLIHLRDGSASDESLRICIICQSSFEIGVLTVCGHKYCKDCLRLWWRQNRNCPACKSYLKANDFHQITYKPQEFTAEEERASGRAESGQAADNPIYSDVSSGLLRELKSIDLGASFGTKIDTLARHIMWLRKHDPGAKAVVFSQYRSFLGVLETAFSRFKIGYSSVDSRGGIERFKGDPAVECFLLHAKAHSSGLNLVNATHVFLCEPLINTAIELQAIARVHRIGQHRPTTIWMYLVSDTVEESIYNLSVSRRLAHILEIEKATKPLMHEQNCGTSFGSFTEVTIDSANFMEMQDAALSGLLTSSRTGGELVRKDDLWQCLFGKHRQKEASHDAYAGDEVGRFLRGEATDQRRAVDIHV